MLRDEGSERHERSHVACGCPRLTADRQTVIARPPGTSTSTSLSPSSFRSRPRRRGPRSEAAALRRSRGCTRSISSFSLRRRVGDTEPEAPRLVDVQDAQFSSFTIDHINIRGWRSHNAELAGHVRLHGAPHIIAVNESHLDRSVLEPGPEFAGYVRVARLDRRDGRTKGGILAYVRSDVEQRVTFLQHARDLTHERSWFTIHGDIGPVLLCIWYRPPSPGETSSIHGFIDEWQSLRDSCVGTIVVGDLNVHHKHLLKRSASVSVEGSLLYRFCCDNGFRQVVKEQTHEDGNILDLVLTDLSELERVEILPRISDHNVVRCFANLAVPISAPRSRTVFEFDVANWPAINQHLSSLSWDHISAMPCDDAAVLHGHCSGGDSGAHP